MLNIAELLLLGSCVGFLSGFFGIGGGTVLVPALMLMGFAIKDAIGISSMQMVFSSIFGSYLNRKNRSLDLRMGLIIGSGGFVGAIFSGFMATKMDDALLESIFLLFAIFALVRLFIQPKTPKKQREVSEWILFVLGIFLGVAGMLVGVGGSILLVPILVGFLHIDIKRAVSSGLFFVVFSSISGFASHYISRGVDLHSGIVVGLSSLAGVYLGIILKERVSVLLQRRLLVLFYLIIVIYLLFRLF
ncbi:MAG: sulfite exporter TauE/SafE family protein [Sulfuricurvum sp.]